MLSENPMNRSGSRLQRHSGGVTRQQRETMYKHKSVLAWFTGLSGAGKSTIAYAVERRLHEQGCHTSVLDGDDVRHGLCADLGFSDSDRSENIRRIGEMSKLFVEAGIITLAAFISPFQSDRKRVRSLMHRDFIEVYCHCPLKVCEQRDVKGLYAKARSGAVERFTGISSPYEPPESPELVLDTGMLSVDVCADRVLALLAERGLFSVL